MIKKPITGGCFCGAIRWEADGVFDAGYCHCSVCRRISGAPVYSFVHFKEGDFRQNNYGLGVGVFVSPEHGFVGGSFINSNDERSRYGGYHWRPLHWGNPAGLNVRAGLVFALVDGYSNTNNGHWFPAILPALTAEYGHFGANLSLAVNPHNGTALGLQLRLRVW